MGLWFYMLLCFSFVGAVAAVSAKSKKTLATPRVERNDAVPHSLSRGNLLPPLAVPPLAARQLTELGLEALRDKNYIEAQKHFLQALNQEPMNPTLRINLGLSFELLQEPHKALREYLLAAQSAAPRSDAQFVALFNIARLYGAFNDIHSALEFYQRALAIRPMSKEVKTNIELLLKKQPPSQNQCNSGQNQQKSTSQQGQKNKSEDNKSGNKKQPHSQGSQPETKKQSGQSETPQQPKEQQPKEQQPKEQQQELSKKQMQNILDNITQQEKKLRQRLNEKRSQPNPGGKNW